MTVFDVLFVRFIIFFGFYNGNATNLVKQGVQLLLVFKLFLVVQPYFIIAIYVMTQFQPWLRRIYSYIMFSLSVNLWLMSESLQNSYFFQPVFHCLFNKCLFFFFFQPPIFLFLLFSRSCHKNLSVCLFIIYLCFLFAF